MTYTFETCWNEIWIRSSRSFQTKVEAANAMAEWALACAENNVFVEVRLGMVSLAKKEESK
jgi:hypothetical protein